MVRRHFLNVLGTAPGLILYDSLEHLGQRGTARSQLGAMVHRELMEDRLAARREAHEHLPPVGFTSLADDQPARHKPIDELDSAVVANLQALGDGRDGWLYPFGQALDRQQKLMLLRLDPRRTGRLLAEVQEAPDRVAKFVEDAVVLGGQFFHKATISYSDISARGSGLDYLIVRFSSRRDA